jgi:hypothetical protein
MHSPRPLPTAAALLSVAAVVMAPALAWACPFCEAPSLTLTEQVAQSDDVVLVKWVDSQKAKAREATSTDGGLSDGGLDIPGSSKTEPARTTFEVVEVVKAREGGLKAGGSVTLARYTPGEKGDLYLLLGVASPVGKATEWGTPLEVDEASFGYIENAPDMKAPTPDRLRYFVDYLEFPDELVASDAYGEFANAPWEEIRKVKDAMPADRLRRWVANPETNVTRLALYGLLLGLCGEEQDAEVLAKKITEPTKDYRLGIDGVISGYLLMTGEEGLTLIEDTKLKKSADVPFSETYAALQAVRFMWTYGEGKIPKERLRESMRILLDRPELADLVIADLARWQDWSVQDRLMELYDQEGYDIPAIKRAIIRYMLVSAKDTDAEGNAEEDAPHVAKGKKYIEQLREKDPENVRKAERFLILR